MRITIEVETTSKQEIEVEFPLFMKHEVPFDSGVGYSAYFRIYEDRRAVTITETSDGEWKYEPSKISPASLGYMFVNKEEYDYEIIAAKVFYRKLHEFQAILADVAPTPAT